MNKLLTKIVGVALGVGLATGVATGVVVGSRAVQPAYAAEAVFYTLTPTSGSNNSYAGNCDIEIDGITWNLTGNSQMQPWRIGGKSITNTDRTLYSKTAMSTTITKVEMDLGAASSVTINSSSLIVASDANFANVVDTKSLGTSIASKITTIQPTSGKTWSNCYFKFIFNVTIGGSNKYIEFNNAKFYYDASGPVAAETTTTLTAEKNTLDGSASPADSTTVTAVVKAGNDVISDASVTFAVEPASGVVSLSGTGLTRTVTAVGEGTAVITASYAGVSGVYAESAGSKTITVEIPEVFPSGTATPIALSTAGGSSASTAKVNGKDAIKAGTGSNAGAVVVSLPANTHAISFRAAGWKGENVVLGISPVLTGLSQSSLTLTSDDGITSNSPFTLSGSERDYLFSLTYKALGASSSITLTATSGKRFVVWDAYSYIDDSTATLSSLEITGDFSKKSYTTAESWSTAGLTVTGTYSDDTQEDLTAYATFTIYDSTGSVVKATPNALGVGSNLTIKVMATIDELDSPKVSISGITVIKVDYENSSSLEEGTYYIMYGDHYFTGAISNGHGSSSTSKPDVAGEFTFTLVANDTWSIINGNDERLGFSANSTGAFAYGTDYTFKVLDTETVDVYHIQSLDQTTRYIGWYASGSDFRSYTSNENIDITLISTSAQQHTITYNANNGSGTMSPTVGYDPAVEYCTFAAPQGKMFSRWNTAADGSGIDYAVGAIATSDLTLYAIWVDKVAVPGNYYSLVTSTSDLIDGSKYIIASAPSNGTLSAMSTTQNEHNRAMTTTSVIDDLALVADNSIQVITLEEVSSNWALKVDGGYLYAAGGSGSKPDNYLKTEAEPDENGNAEWAITFGENNNAVITGQGNATRNILQFNSTNAPHIFSCYGGGQSEVYLYKLSFEDTLLENILCDGDGNHTFSTGFTWADLKTVYQSLGASEQLALKTASNAGLARYDYLIAKYGTGVYENFIGRNITPIGGSRVIVSLNNDTTVLFVVIIAIVAITSTGAIFLLRKKKEEN